MSNYVKATDFASKDALLTGDPLKIVSGTEINDEFNAIQTAVNTKADINSPTLTGVPSAPTAAAGTATTQLATTSFVTSAVATAIAAAKEVLFPVGSIYTNATNATNPATLLGFGTWTRFGEGRVLVSQDGGDASFNVAEETGGSKNAIVPSHSHTASTDTPSIVGTFDIRRSFFNSAVNDTIFSRTGKFTYVNQGSASRLDAGGNNQAESYQRVEFDASHSHSVTVNSTGESVTNKNLQPYIVVYMWKRTA